MSSPGHNWPPLAALKDLLQGKGRRRRRRGRGRDESDSSQLRPLIIDESQSGLVTAESLLGRKSASHNDLASLSQAIHPLPWKEPVEAAGSPMRHVPEEVVRSASVISGLGRGGVKLIRKPKPTAPRSQWVVINKAGQLSRMKADKRALTRAKELGVTARELRMFDPVYQHTHSLSTRILVRENALLFVMEGLQLIITADEVFIPLSSHSSTQAFAVNFVTGLEALLIRAHAARVGKEWKAKACAEPSEEHSRAHDSTRSGVGTSSVGSDEDESEEQPSTDDMDDDDDELLAFELTVLEFALSTVTERLKTNVEDLERTWHPALENLTKLVDRANLDKVRILKNKHSRLTKRVEAVVEELDRIMDDDEDMAKMYLSHEIQQLDPDRSVPHSASRSSYYQAPSPRASSGYMQGLSPSSRGLRAPPSPMEQEPSIGAYIPEHAGDLPPLSPSSAPYRMYRQDSVGGMSVEPEEEEPPHVIVENILELYYTTLDFAFDRLKTLDEIIDNTEEMVNIDLDTSRNRLIKLEILLTGCTFAFTIYAVVAGVLGENLVLPDSITDQFLIVNLATICFCVLISAGMYAWCRCEGLL